MTFDTHANLVLGSVATSPSPASSGTSVGLQSGQGASFPTPPFNCTVWPAGAQATAANSEIVRVSGKSGDTLTIARGPQSGDPGGINRAIQVGDQIALTVTAKSLTDIEAAVAALPAAPLTSFQGRATQAATLTKADVTGTGLAASDVGADASGAATAAQAASLQKTSNLSDLASSSTARTNLGLGTAATQASSAFDAAGAASAVQAASLQKSSNLSDVADSDTSRANLRVPVLRECKACSTVNVASLSGTTTIDTVALSANDRVLLTGQTTASQNGPWVVQSGAWTRPNDYATGATFVSRLCPAPGGSANSGVYQLKSSATVTVDTTATTWASISGGSGGSGIPVLTKLLVAGHSIAAGSAPLPNAANRITTKLAQQLGATETNLGAASASMLAADDATNANPGNVSTGNNWPHFMQSYAPARTAAPYLASTVVVDIMWGINDIAKWGPANAGFLADWKSVLFALCAYARSGAVKFYNDASVVYGGSGVWTVFGQTTQGAGSGNEYNPTNGATVTITLPADYDGQAVNLFFLTGAEVATADSARYTVTIGGTQVAQQSSAGINVATSNSKYQTQPYCVRLPAGTTGLTGGAVIVVTFDQIVGNAFFNCWAIESNPAPLVVLADTLRTPAGYSAYSTWPYTPTDADIIALNAANAQVAAMFSDGMVIADGADAVIAKGGNAADWSNVHPMARVAGEVASQQRKAIAAALTTVPLSTLGALGTT